MKYAAALVAVGLFFCLVSSVAGATRNYYLSIEEGTWDYGPMKMDGATGIMFSNSHMSMPGMSGMEMNMVGHDASFYAVRTSKRIGRRYKKARYYRYTDATFSTKWASDPRWEHLGILGPIIYCEVGDTVVVTLKNMAMMNEYSFHAHGLLYQKSSEGMMDQMGETGNKGVVAPGDTYTYTFQAVARSGPGPNDASSIVWLYHSHVDSVADPNSGLVGAIVVGKPGTLAGPADDPHVAGVDHEFFTLFYIFDENESNYFLQNVKQAFKRNAPKMDLSDPEFVESNRKYTINGFFYNNLPGLEAMSGETVRWYLMALGNNDIHTAHWHGQTLITAGMRVDTESILPAQSKVLDMVPDVDGSWLLHCHVDHHIHAGMSAVFTVGEMSGSMSGSMM